MTTHKPLTPVVDLIKSALDIYFKKPNLIYLLKFFLVCFLAVAGCAAAIGVVIALTASVFIAGGLSYQPQPSQLLAPVVLAGVLSIFAILVFVLVMSVWLQIFQIEFLRQVTRGKLLGIKETFKLSWGRRVWPFFVAGLLYALMAALGFIFLIIPGIIFLVWFSFFSYIVVEENRGAFSSLGRSRELVSGYFWPVLGRFLVFFLLSILVEIGSSIIPFAGAIIAIFFGPFFVLLPYLLYRDLMKVKGSAEPVREAGSA